jgi:uncharacterized membrane protein
MLMAMVQLGLISITFQKLGLSNSSGILLLFASLLSSIINIPIMAVETDQPVNPEQNIRNFMLHRVTNQFNHKIIIAINVGGGVIPILFCLYLFLHRSPAFIETSICLIAVTLVSYLFSRPVPGVGIGMPILVAPLTAAISAIALGGEQRATLAYIAGTLGVLIGADLLRLKNVRHLGATMVSIGGAGTFDGIFITGLLAVLLT